MSQIVSQNPMDITIEIVDEYIGRIPEKTLRLARDYIYEDRCIRKMRMPGRLIAELRGYHDSYIPHFELSKDLWQGGCTCSRPAPCAHIGALLLSFREHPEQFVFPPYAFAMALQNSWNVLFEATTGKNILRLVPEIAPWWMLPRNIAHTKTEPMALDNLERIIHQPQMLVDLHPSWLDDPAILNALRGWKNPQLIRKPGLLFWVKLWAYNPFLPLDHIFSSFPGEVEALTPVILAELWNPGVIPFPRERQWQRVQRLLSLLEVIPSVPIVFLWDQFAAMDPLFLGRTHALIRQGQMDQAIHYIEQHWPEDEKEQHMVRQALINWLPESKKLPYLIADCLETGSLPELQELKKHLTPEAYEDLTNLFNRRWASTYES
ncbi:hypothetical protein SAMN00768000_2836 [Sulfobacillus thermosulfidooxidans DSM 9293]|uniref:SWIM-type domain-containing protein n=1 Tax=Sulfobacillus thermosulfidooxidans (strain DSM 9293 / VKM B-1269 / AT-1) TaxID=929705 RepID=A0A1W1WL52_SULTA|nr:hypothetical protein [Sulfobacillus thermosulfidooxidans]SMC06463.1 hypothetical protein SAMN00768000_2836 [Sulfobacillus thermosulfidooxidans DSM 9293]